VFCAATRSCLCARFDKQEPFANVFLGLGALSERVNLCVMRFADICMFVFRQHVQVEAGAAATESPPLINNSRRLSHAWRGHPRRAMA
jgi:hypothetical protein